MRVERGHGGDRGWGGDECGAEDADRGRHHYYFDCVVDICGMDVGVGLLRGEEETLPEITTQPSGPAKYVVMGL